MTPHPRQLTHLRAMAGLPGRALLLATLSLSTALVAGCNSSGSDATSTSSSATTRQAQKEATPPYQTIRRGMIPFSHLITLTGRLEIVDLTDNNKVVLKKTKILPNTLVTLNPGEIQFNTTAVSKNPLVRKHIYELRLYPQ